MFITAIYQDNQVSLIDISRLGELISSYQIKQFLRFHGMVTGVDPLRRKRVMVTKAEKVCH